MRIMTSILLLYSTCKHVWIIMYYIFPVGNVIPFFCA